MIKFEMMEQQQSEINNLKRGEIYFTRQTEILLYSVCNGIFATIAFLVFLYFVFRYIMKISAESNDVKEKQAEEGCINDPPPPYEEVVNGIRY